MLTKQVNNDQDIWYIGKLIEEMSGKEKVYSVLYITHLHWEDSCVYIVLAMLDWGPESDAQYPHKKKI